MPYGIYQLNGIDSYLKEQFDRLAPLSVPRTPEDIFRESLEGCGQDLRGKAQMALEALTRDQGDPAIQRIARQTLLATLPSLVRQYTRFAAKTAQAAFALTTQNESAPSPTYERRTLTGVVFASAIRLSGSDSESALNLAQWVQSRKVDDVGIENYQKASFFSSEVFSKVFSEDCVSSPERRMKEALSSPPLPLPRMLVEMHLINNWNGLHPRTLLDSVLWLHRHGAFFGLDDSMAMLFAAPVGAAVERAYNGRYIDPGLATRVMACVVPSTPAQETLLQRQAKLPDMPSKFRETLSLVSPSKAVRLYCSQMDPVKSILPDIFRQQLNGNDPAQAKVRLEILRMLAQPEAPPELRAQVIPSQAHARQALLQRVCHSAACYTGPC